MKNAVLMVVMTMALTSVRAGDCYWTGGGDGVNWSDTANWDVPPKSGYGDILWFTNSVSTCNDVENFCPRTINFRSEGPITVSGRQIMFSNGGTGIDSWCPVEMDAPIKVSSNNNIFMHHVKFVYNGQVTVEGVKTLTLKTHTTTPPASDNKGNMPEVRINGGVSAPEGTLQFMLGRNAGRSACSPFFVNSVLDVKNLYWYGDWRCQMGYVTVGGQKWQNAYVGFGACCAAVENAYGPNAILSWPTYRNSDGDWDLNGYNQTIDRIWSESFPTNTTGGLLGDHILSAQPATLTMNATGNGRCWADVRGRLSLVWAPRGPYTMEFLDRDYETAGDLFVSNGTMSVLGTATFRNVGEIRVGDGATFDLATTAANALTGTRNLLIEGAGVFRVAATAATPFSSVRVRMGANAKLAVPAGVTLTVGALTVGDAVKADDIYTGETWIDGEGSVKVDSTTLAAASWKAPADGDWATASNWQSGAVPSETTAVSIDVAGADYAVTAADGLVRNADLAVGGGAVDGTATFAPQGSVTQTNGKLSVRPGGKVSLGTDVNYVFNSSTSWRNPTATIDIAGGALELDGGTFLADPFYGCCSIGGSGKTQGRLGISAGTFTIDPWQSADGGVNPQPVTVFPGGMIDVSGTGVFCLRSYRWGAKALSLKGGAVRVSDSGKFLVGINAAIAASTTFEYDGFGTLTFADDAQMVREADKGVTLSLVADTVRRDLEIAFADRARLDIGASSTLRVSHGSAAGNKVSLTLDSEATSVLGGTVFVGSNNGRGEMYLKRGRAEIGDYGLTVGGMGYTSSVAGVTPVGLVEVSGGSLDVKGGNMGGSTQERLCGIVVGSSQYTGGDKMPEHADGELVLTAGVITNRSGHTVVGFGRADGRVVISGGSFVVCKNGNGANALNVMAIGCLNGSGSWTMTGGTATLAPSVYVGGCDTNRFRNALKLADHTEDSAAVGVLRVSNASFATAGALVLGERGTGTLEIGPGGTVSAGNFAVSNAASTVTIKLGADGSGNLAIAGDLAVEAGAKLVIDASAVGPENLVRGVNVVTCGTASRPYADADVTFIGDAKGVLRFKKTAKGWRIPGTRGMMLLLR